MDWRVVPSTLLEFTFGEARAVEEREGAGEAERGKLRRRLLLFIGSRNSIDTLLDPSGRCLNTPLFQPSGSILLL